MFIEHTGVTITWDVNKTGYGHNEIIQFGILQWSTTTYMYHEILPLWLLMYNLLFHF